MDALREVLTGGKVRVLSLARVSGVKRSLSDFFANNESAGLPTSETFCFPLKPTVNDSTGCGVAKDWGPKFAVHSHRISNTLRLYYIQGGSSGRAPGLG